MQLPVMATVFVGFAMLLMFIGRVNTAYSAVEAAARYAARTISLARDPAEAIDVALADATATVEAGSSRCESMAFTPAIYTEQVTVTITCTVNLSDVDLFGVPGSWTVTATVDEPRDRWRESTGP